MHNNIVALYSSWWHVWDSILHVVMSDGDDDHDTNVRRCGVMMIPATLVVGFTTGGCNFQVFRFLQRISRSADFIWFYFLSFLCWYCDRNEGGLASWYVLVYFGLNGPSLFGWRHCTVLFILRVDPQTVLLLSKFYLWLLCLAPRFLEHSSTYLPKYSLI